MIPGDVTTKLFCLKTEGMEHKDGVRIAILYAYKEGIYAAANLRFFLEWGVDTRLSDREHIFIVNGGECSVEGTLHNRGLHVIKRENVGWDFGGWSHALRSIDVDEFTHFVFINCSVSGPHMPMWMRKDRIAEMWPYVFLDRIDDNVKLVGTTINDAPMFPAHVQSMFMATDRCGLSVLLEAGIFDNNEADVGKWDLIVMREIASSLAILGRGYQIGGIAPGCSGATYDKYGRVDATKRIVAHHFDPYCGTYTAGRYELDPVDLIFFKTNRRVGAGRLQQCADTRRWDRERELSKMEPLHRFAEWVCDQGIADGYGSRGGEEGGTVDGWVKGATVVRIRTNTAYAGRYTHEFTMSQSAGEIGSTELGRAWGLFSATLNNTRNGTGREDIWPVTGGIWVHTREIGESDTPEYGVAIKLLEYLKAWTPLHGVQVSEWDHACRKDMGGLHIRVFTKGEDQRGSKATVECESPLGGKVRLRGYLKGEVNANVAVDVPYLLISTEDEKSFCACAFARYVRMILCCV